MHATHVQYLIAGAGAAGSAAAQAIRLRDPKGSILLVGQEVNRPYQRPRLSHDYLLRRVSRTELITLPVGWYADNDVRLVTGRRVARIDVPRHLVTLDSGEEVAYDRLLIATGVGPRPLNVPGADLPNVFDLRTLEDADRLVNAMDSARREGRPHDETRRGVAGAPRGRVVVIGGGLLGVELSAVLTQAGLRVDLLVAAGHPWGRFAGEQAGGAVARRLQAEGVNVCVHTRVARLEGDGRAQRVITDDGRTFHCDFVVTAIGSVFNREIVRGTPLNAEKHLLVDDHCRTNVPDLFAAGDCAAVFDPLFGKHRVLDHWDSARLTGTIAGANMAGDGSMSYDVVNHFGSEVFGLRLSAWGESRHVAHRHTRRPSGASDTWLAEFGVSPTGRISQTLWVGAEIAPGEDAALREMVARRLDVSQQIDRLTDPTVPLTSLL